MTSNTKKDWTHYFRDTTHKTFGVSSLFFRLLPDNRKQSINREYYAQKYLAPTGLTPKPYFRFISPLKLFPSFIVEEKIDFHKKYIKNDQFIINVSKSLRILHDYSRSQRKLINKHIPEDIFLKNGIYDPLIILENFIELPFTKISKLKPNLVTKEVEDSIQRISKLIRILAKNTHYKSEYCSMIHGDLNDTNIVIRIDNESLAYLDWADSRWDIASCDLAQFIYLHKLTNREKNLFLKSYADDWITEEILEIHRLLLIGWDIIYLMTINLQIPPDKIDRLLPLKKRIWDERKLAI